MRLKIYVNNKNLIHSSNEDCKTNMIGRIDATFSAIEIELELTLLDTGAKALATQAKTARSTTTLNILSCSRKYELGS